MAHRFLATILLATAMALAARSTPALAQHARGIAQCLAGCAKSDKPCQDRCLPSAQIGAGAHACLAECRRNAKDPDLMVNLEACIGRCLQGVRATH